MTAAALRRTGSGAVTTACAACRSAHSALGGEVAIQNRDEGGTRVTARLPLE